MVEKEPTPIEPSLVKMREKMSRYSEGFQERHKSTVCVFSCGDFDQEFLKGLIPKKE